MKKTQWQNFMSISKTYVGMFFAVVFICIQSANAQMFDEDLVEPSSGWEQNVQKEETNVKKATDNNFIKPRASISSSSRTWAKQNNKVEAAEKNNIKVDVRKVEEQSSQNDDKIYMYYRNFKISRGINGRVNCSMRFFVYSTVPEKITSISYRLKWPNMETTLSFDNVQPNTPTYYDYALLGEGCYSMDTPPNIIVNRCRIKGLSQKHCSSIIQWTK